MSGDFNDKIDKTVGKAKEATGKATGDEELADKGRGEQAKAEAKEAVKKAGDHLGEAADKVKNVFKK